MGKIIVIRKLEGLVIFVLKQLPTLFNHEQKEFMSVLLKKPFLANLPLMIQSVYHVINKYV